MAYPWGNHEEKGRQDAAHMRSCSMDRTLDEIVKLLKRLLKIMEKNDQGENK